MVSLDGYKCWLKLNQYSEKAPCKQPSTIYNYILGIKHVLKWEAINIVNLANNINKIVKDYDKDGIKASFGDEKHGTVINSLKCFKSYVNLCNRKICISIHRRRIKKLRGSFYVYKIRKCY